MSYGKTVKVEVSGGNAIVISAPRDTEMLGRIYLRGSNSNGPYTIIPGPINSRSFSKGRWLTRKHNAKSKRGKTVK